MTKLEQYENSAVVGGFLISYKDVYKDEESGKVALPVIIRKIDGYPFREHPVIAQRKGEIVIVDPSLVPHVEDVGAEELISQLIQFSSKVRFDLEEGKTLKLQDNKDVILGMLFELKVLDIKEITSGICRWNSKTRNKQVVESSITQADTYTRESSGTPIDF